MQLQLLVNTTLPGVQSYPKNVEINGRSVWESDSVITPHFLNRLSVQICEGRSPIRKSTAAFHEDRRREYVQMTVVKRINLLYVNR
jgi:hypothetical protein